MTKVIPQQNCRKCGKDSGTKIVCDECRLELTKSQISAMDHQFQLAVIELFDCTCVDCGKSAEATSGELCGDHLEQKNSAPESRYDLAAAVCRCMDCHTGRHAGTVKRYPPKEKMPKQTQERAKKHKREKCSYFSCNLAPVPTSKKGRCVMHFNT